MLCSINNNELTLYEVEINKNRLKAIRKSIIAKYGQVNKLNNITIGNFYDIIEKDPWEMNEIVIADLRYIEDEIEDEIESLKMIQIPNLAITLEEIVKGEESAIPDLHAYKSYYDSHIEISPQKIGEIPEDMLGYVYIYKILENIKLIPVTTEDYIADFNNLNKLKQSEKSLVPNSLVEEMDISKKTKKIGTIK